MNPSPLQMPRFASVISIRSWRASSQGQQLGLLDHTQIELPG